MFCTFGSYKIVFAKKLKSSFYILKQRPPNNTCHPLVKTFSTQISFSHILSYNFIVTFMTRLLYINAYNCNKFDYQFCLFKIKEIYIFICVEILYVILVRLKTNFLPFICIGILYVILVRLKTNFLFKIYLLYINTN